jgi:hypothetical protein
MKILSKELKAPASFSQYAIKLALVVAFLLLIPFVAMQLDNEVNWSPADYVLAFILLFGAGMAYRILIGKTGNILFRLAAGIAAATALFLIWSNLAVGLIGSENNPANLMYLGVLAVLFIAVIIARFNANGMAIALFSTAISQVIVTIIAVIAELGSPENTSVQLILINGFFITLWVISGLLFLFAEQSKKGKN